MSSSDSESEDYQSLYAFEPDTYNPKGPVVRDTVWYKADGDVVFRVGCRLFRVHRFIITQDSSIFASMFTLPVPGRSGVAEGASDEKPVVIDESPGQFANLLWVLYALPADIHRLGSSAMHLFRLLDISEMANKYQFTTTAAWGIDLVFRKLNRTWSKYFSGCSNDDFSRLLDVAYLCGHKELQTLIVTKWSARIASGELRPALAIIAAEQYDITSLLGRAYFMQLIETSSAPKFIPPSRLSQLQVNRLLYGQHSLISFWDSLREDIPAIPAVNCYSHPTCEAAWEYLWGEAWIASHGTKACSVDILAKMRALYTVLRSKQPANIRGSCWSSVMSQLSVMTLELEDTLADHFVDADDV